MIARRAWRCSPCWRARSCPRSASAHATIVADHTERSGGPQDPAARGDAEVERGGRPRRARRQAARRLGRGGQDRSREARAGRPVDGGARRCRRAWPTAPTSSPGASSPRTRTRCRARSRSASARRARSSSSRAARRARPSGRSTRSAAGIAFLGLALALGGAVVVFALWPGGAADARGRRLGVGRGRRVARRQRGRAAHAGSVRVRRPGHGRLLVALVQPRHAVRPRARGADRAGRGVPGAVASRAAVSRLRCAAWR